MRPAERASVGTALILSIEENAFLVADIVNNEKNLVDVTTNILSSIRVMQSRDASQQNFPSLDTLRMADDAHLIVPSQSVRELAVNGAVRSSVAKKILERYFVEFKIGWKPISIVHYTRPGTCINRPLH